MPIQTILIQAYLEMPPVTRAYTTACVITTICVQLDLVSPFQIYFNPNLVIQGQLWRLITTFLFLGPFGINFLFNMTFTYKYCRVLEENSFRGKTADFVVLFIFGMVSILTIAFYFVNLIFLGQAFTVMLVYVCSRRNPHFRISFFGFLTFQAPYLPFALLAFSFLIGNSVSVDLLGICVGHLYYFLEDILPYQPGGCRPLKAPKFLRALCDGVPEDPDYNPPPEDRPGGFDWGNQNRQPQQE